MTSANKRNRPLRYSVDVSRSNDVKENYKNDSLTLNVTNAKTMTAQRRMLGLIVIFLKLARRGSVRERCCKNTPQDEGIY